MNDRAISVHYRNAAAAEGLVFRVSLCGFLDVVLDIGNIVLVEQFTRFFAVATPFSGVEHNAVATRLEVRSAGEKIADAIPVLNDAEYQDENDEFLHAGRTASMQPLLSIASHKRLGGL